LQEGNDEYSAAEKEVSIRILTVGVNSLHKSGIKMYPNPVKEKLFIELTDNANCVISIYNIQGEVLLSKKANSQRETIDLSLLPNGVYFVRIRDPRNTIVHKIIKR
ncbi:MAG: T9SS type A sorting domain-containing protein, partial [Bacteroidales bacterium]|nr:T9SS type A sorting domain-containing protein [Bacteroidales bacterium]